MYFLKAPYVIYHLIKLYYYFFDIIGNMTISEKVNLFYT